MVSRFGSFEGVPTVGRITPIIDKDAEIPHDLWDPHYTDRRFLDGTTDGLTIFVDPEVTLVRGDFVDEVGEGLVYNYSDRVQQWLGYDVVRAAAERAESEVDHVRSARFIEQMLRHAYKDDSIWLGHLRAGVNRGNGYSYKIYGTRKDPN